MTSGPTRTPGRSLSETAYDALRNRILACELGPGERLTERQTATDLGLGLSPVRDALTRLVQDGLVQVIPRKGYRVAPLTMKSVDDLFHAWVLIGPEIARLGVVRADAEQTAALRRLVAGADQALAMTPTRGRAARFIQLADEMFDLLAIATDNERLLEIYRSLAGEMSRVWTLILTADPEPEVLHAANAGWQPSIEDRDGEHAAQIARAFIQASHVAAMRVLQSWPSVRHSEVVPLRG
jgi:DNA-binding GntR family transcriptional regulator